MSKTSTTIKNKWNAQHYDALTVRLPKGRKQALEALAAARGQSVNRLVCGLIEGELERVEGEKAPDP